MPDGCSAGVGDGSVGMADGVVSGVGVGIGLPDGSGGAVGGTLGATDCVGGTLGAPLRGALGCVVTVGAGVGLASGPVDTT